MKTRKKPAIFTLNYAQLQILILVKIAILLHIKYSFNYVKIFIAVNTILSKYPNYR